MRKDVVSVGWKHAFAGIYALLSLDYALMDLKFSETYSHKISVTEFWNFGSNEIYETVRIDILRRDKSHKRNKKLKLALK